ncbi:hypothetical protein RJ55_02542 [Drechmeria coniospora]|nr:hypothetical protein RJ55_02542 [Drechmeria coniospora]
MMPGRGKSKAGNLKPTTATFKHGLPTPTTARFPAQDTLQGPARRTPDPDWDTPPPGTPLTAAPWIPHPTDPSSCPQTLETRKRKREQSRQKAERQKKAREAQRVAKAARDAQKAERVIERAKQAAQRKEKKAKSARQVPRGRRQNVTQQERRQRTELLKFPAEVRLRIFRHLLVADKDILVHAGWALVYKRQAIGLSTAIMRTCRIVHGEASSVLYGDNVFRYRLRDASSPVSDLPSHGRRHARGDDRESDSDWEEDNTVGVAASRSRTQSDISVVKHLPLFRRLAVEAEDNRYSESTKDAMARAIRVFAANGDGQRPRVNVRSFTIRVAPLWNPEVRPKGAFTFIDFFESNSPVMKAILAVRCRYFRVDLMTQYMDGPSPKSGCSLTIDRSHEMIRTQVRETKRDFWARELLMRETRESAANRSVEALDNLGREVAKFCVEYVQGVTGGTGAWNSFEIDHLVASEMETEED